MLNAFTFSEMLAIMFVVAVVCECHMARFKWRAFMAMVKLVVEDAEQDARLRYAQATLAELPEPIVIPEGADICVCPGCDEHFVTGMPGTKKVGAFDFCSDTCWERPMPFPALPMDRRYPC